MGIASNALGAIPSGTRDIARATASSLVLSYMRKRFRLPLVSWSDDIKRATAHCARYDLICQRGFNPTAGGDIAIRDSYLDAIKWLEQLAKGNVEPEAVVDSTPDAEEAAPLVASEPSKWGFYGGD